MDIKEFDVSTKGNRYALVFQDYLTEWPEVYSIPDHQVRTVAVDIIINMEAWGAIAHHP